ncbi:MAG TPA: GTP-binding protein [Symbiobacteriaceae bacterium]|nr:GTP-binding protein [Symbiobacteriaceae bacterium]
MALLKEQERICRQLGHRAGLQAGLGSQAEIHLAQGHLQEAMALLREREAICRELGHRLGLQMALGGQAEVLMAGGDLAGALALLQEQEVISRELNDLTGLQRSLRNQTAVLNGLGDLEGARILLVEQERIARETGDRETLALSLASQAAILARQGVRLREGVHLAQEALDVAVKHGLTALVQQVKSVQRELKKSERRGRTARSARRQLTLPLDEVNQDTPAPPSAFAQVPQGLLVRQILTDRKASTAQVIWSPAADMLIAFGPEHAFIWDVVTGRQLARLGDGRAPVLSAAWSPDGSAVALGYGDSTTQIWNPGEPDRCLSASTGFQVTGVAWLTDGRLLLAGRHDTLQIWDVVEGRRYDRTLGVDLYVERLAVSPDRALVAIVDGLRNHIWLWAADTEQIKLPLEGHRAPITSLAWLPDGKLVSGSADGTVRMWDVHSGTQSMVLEGHTNVVTAVSVSRDGQIIAAYDKDRVVRLWSVAKGRSVATLRTRAGDGRALSSTAYGMAFSPALDQLAVVDPATVDIYVFDVDSTALLALGSDGEAKYTTARIAMVGESGVGKTGLGLRLATGQFHKSDSTHGQQFWVLDELRTVRSDGTQCEAILWDLAGQADYRLTHKLYLHDADQALVLFDLSQRYEPLREPEYWLKALNSLGGRSRNAILIGSKLDVGDTNLTTDYLEQFCATRQIAGGYVKTSARTGAGIQELIERLQQIIDWEQMTTTSTTTTFRLIKDHVLRLRADVESAGKQGDQHPILLSTKELHDLMVAQGKGLSLLDNEVKAAVENLSDHGYVTILRDSRGVERILLRPEVLNNLAASFVLAARAHPKGLGALDEDRLRSGGYAFRELEGLREQDQITLVDSVMALCLERKICFRKRVGSENLLIFPWLINERRPRVDRELIEDTTYVITGAVENAYAELVVLLGYTSLFYEIEHWQHQAQFLFPNGDVCGFREEPVSEAETELVLYHSARMSGAKLELFRNLFQEFLATCGVEWTPYPPAVCLACGDRPHRKEVIRRIRKGATVMTCDCGAIIPLKHSAQDEQTGRPAELVREIGRATRRSVYESALARVKRNQPETPPTCFISYAFTDEHQGWVERQLARDLENAGIQPIVLINENQPGAYLMRSLERIADADFVLVVGTPAYLEKCKAGKMVFNEVDLIYSRLENPRLPKESVITSLREGEKWDSLPPLLQGKVDLDFRDDKEYFMHLFNLVVALYRISPNSAQIVDLKDRLRRASAE